MSHDRSASRLGLAAALAGLIAGLIEVTAGPSIRSLVGDKLDTTRLGLTTMLLGVVALVAALALRREGGAAGGRRLAIAAGLAVPGLIGFSTTGTLWLLPGPLMIFTSGLVLARTRRDQLDGTLDERHVLIGLASLCGVYYVWLGATALGVAGALGMIGGLLIWAAVSVPRRWHTAAIVLLVAGTLPFAVATWWSVVTPLIAVLALVSGAIAVRPIPRVTVASHGATRSR